MNRVDRAEAERLQEELRERINPGWREQLAMHRAWLKSVRETEAIEKAERERLTDGNTKHS